METLTDYLIKSSVWLTGFSLVYFLFLRNERFFMLNRIFLIMGMLAAIGFPLITFRYFVLVPMLPAAVSAETPLAFTASSVVVQQSMQPENLLFYFYLSGILYLIFRLLKQIFSVIRIIRKSGSTSYNKVRLVRTDRYPAPFSFFSFVFVNPSINDAETNEIVHHEQQHIRQRHWIDLLLFELLCILQWFNPMIWLYGRFIRQNHEYLADEVALQRTSNPAMYRAALLNQMVGGPVIELANSFNYSLNKKRFTMMKQTINTPIRKLKLLLAVPVIAGVFYAFSEPEYQFIQDKITSEKDVHTTMPAGKIKTTIHPVNSGNVSVETTSEKGKPLTKSETNQQSKSKQKKEKKKEQLEEKLVTGRVVDSSDKPLEGASVVVSGTNYGTVTDNDGNFQLKMAEVAPIVVSFVGYRTIKVLPETEVLTTFKMDIENIGIDKVVAVARRVPKLTNKELTIKNTAEKEDIFSVVERMPEFPGGVLELRKFLAKTIKYPVIAQENGIQGLVYVTFVVDREGAVSNVKIHKGVDPSLDAEAIRVVSRMPKWNPGIQHGKAVDVYYTIPIEFVLE